VHFATSESAEGPGSHTIAAHIGAAQSLVAQAFSCASSDALDIARACGQQPPQHPENMVMTHWLSLLH
jgi:hypothetical protein